MRAVRKWSRNLGELAELADHEENTQDIQKGRAEDGDAAMVLIIIK